MPGPSTLFLPVVLIVQVRTHRVICRKPRALVRPLRGELARWKMQHFARWTHREALGVAARALRSALGHRCGAHRHRQARHCTLGRCRDIANYPALELVLAGYVPLVTGI